MHRQSQDLRDHRPEAPTVNRWPIQKQQVSYRAASTEGKAVVPASAHSPQEDRNIVSGHSP